jgi:hypothetical protein
LSEKIVLANLAYCGDGILKPGRPVSIGVCGSLADDADFAVLSLAVSNLIIFDRYFLPSSNP